MIFIQNFIQLFLKSAKQLLDHSRILIDFLQIKLVHNLRQSRKHFARLIQLGHIHAVQNHVRCFGNLLRHFCAKRYDRLQIIDLNRTDDIVHFLRTCQCFIHLLPVRHNIILLHDFRNIFHCPTLWCTPCSCFTEIKSHSLTLLPQTVFLSMI